MSLVGMALRGEILEGNFFPNPEFEQGTALDQPARGVFEGWMRGGSDLSASLVSTEKTVSASHALALEDDTGNGWGEWSIEVDLRPHLVPGVIFEARWHEIFNTSGAMGIRFTYRNENGVIVLVERAPISGQSAGWHGSVTASTFAARKMVLAIPVSAETVTVSIHSGNSASATGSVLIDDFSMRVLPNDDPGLDVNPTDLGAVPLNSNGSVLTLPVRNSGVTQNLELREVTLEGAVGTASEIESFPASLAPQEEGLIRIQVTTADTLGSVEGEVVIDSNDQSDPSVRVPVVFRVTNSNGLLAHYPLDETEGDAVTDRSGNGYDGDLFSIAGGAYGLGAPALTGEGNSLRLEDSGSSFGAGSIQVEGLPTLQTFSVSFWMRIDPNDIGSRSVLFARLPSMELSLPGNTFNELEWAVEGGFQDLKTDPVLQAARVYHVVFTREIVAPGERHVRVYVDGQLLAENLNAVNYQDDAMRTLEIGAADGQNGFTGWLDDIQIYERSISATEAKMLFDHPGTTLPTPGTTRVDSDGDGFSDAAEAVAGTDASDPSSFLRVEEIALVQGGVEVRWNSVAAVRYRVEASADLESWQLLKETEGDGGLQAALDTASESIRYFRIHVGE